MEGITIIETAAFQELLSKIESMTKVIEIVDQELKGALKPYLTVAEVASLTGFGKSWVMDHKSEIGYSTIGSSLRFKRKDVDEFMEERYFKNKSPRRRYN